MAEGKIVSITTYVTYAQVTFEDPAATVIMCCPMPVELPGKMFGSIRDALDETITYEVDDDNRVITLTLDA